MSKHRGLSAVVGTVFLVAVVVSALSYVTYSMNILGNFSESLMTEEKRQKDKQDEKFEITSVNITPANKLDGIVTNTGQNPLKIKSLWIEEIGNINSVKKFNINATIAPGDQLNLINNVNFDMDSTKGYTMKIISGRGEVQTFHVNSVNSNNLYLTAQTIPAVVSTEFDTTILLTVTNNSTNNAPILNLTPAPLDIDDSLCSPDCVATYVSGPTPNSYPSLKQGETATFTWIYSISGANADQITFTTSLTNGILTNTASTSVEVRDIVSALESGTALSTLGIQTITGSDDIMYLHDESWFTPNGEYQLQTSTPDNTGDFIDVDNEDPTWISNNATSTIVLPAGVWNASLNYITEFLPDTLVLSGANQVDMILHLNKNIDNEPDSSGNTAGLDRCNGSSSPTYFSTGGPDNSPYYHFDGSNDCFASNFNVDSSNYVNISGSPDTTSFWFKANNSTVNRAVMFRVDDNTSGYTKDFYQISLGDGTVGSAGKIVFEFDTNNGASRIKCISSSKWDNNVWHHVVAVRDGSSQCKLYMDGNTTPVATDPSHGYANTSVDATNKFHIGYNGASEYFTGDIDQIFHWNDKALSSNEVSSLYNAKYGDTATKINFSIYVTDEFGNNIGAPIKESLNYDIKFADSGNLDDSGSYNSLADNIWTQINYTTGSINQVTLDSTQRLNFTMTYVSGLDMILKHDDNTMISPKSSYLQTTTPSVSFPSYFTYDKSERLQVIAYNSGPYGSWFVYQGTRAIFDSLTSTTSYAGLICSVNSTQSDPCDTAGGNSNWRVTEDRDSIFIPVGSSVSMYFWQIQDRPDRDVSGGIQIPAGDYHMYVFIDGYDETGKSFLRQMDVGRVKVID